jgi:hypothetical protein
MKKMVSVILPEVEICKLLRRLLKIKLLLPGSVGSNPDSHVLLPMTSLLSFSSIPTAVGGVFSLQGITV